MMNKRNGGASQDIMMNLLGESSDSEPELLNLPPLKGKKPKKRKNPYGSPENNLCNLWTFFKVFLIILLVGSILVMVIVSFWLSNQVYDLRQKLQLMESKNQGSLESYQDLHGQIQVVNKSLHAVKMDTDKATQTILNNLKEMSQKIIVLNTTTESLKEGLKAAPELKQISNKVPVISKSVASLGVDVKAIKTTVEELEDWRKKTEKQVQQLVNSQMDETKTHGPTPASDSRHKPNTIVNPDFEDETLQKFDSMAQLLSQVNSSLWLRLVGLQQELSMHQNHFVTLENVTSVLQKEMEKVKFDHATVIKPGSGREQGSANADVNQLETKVKDMVLQTISDLGLQNTTAEDSKNLDSLLNNLDNITSIVKSLRKQFQVIIQDHDSMKNPDGSDADRTTPAQQEVAVKIQGLENSVHAVQRDLQMTVKHLSRNTNQLKNLTAMVDGIKRYMAIRDKEQQITQGTAQQNTQNTSTTGKVDTTMSPVRTEKPADTGNVSISNAENATSTVNISTQGTTLSPKTTTRPHLTFGNIKTMEDLDLKFSRWVHNGGSDRIDPDILQDYMADPPSKEDLKPYDKNNDGMYSKEELANALGLSEGETNDAGER